SALEAVRGFGVQAVTPGAATDAGRVEVGTCEETASGRLGNLGLLAAHHAREHERAFGIGDHQVVGGEDALLAVEGDEALALPGGADAAPRAAHAVEVEGGARLAGLEENAVGCAAQTPQRPQGA